MSHTIAVKELPEPVRRALREVRYGRRDIEVKPATTYAMAGASGDGSKAFVIAVNLRTGQYKVEYGSWGGSNMFNSRNPVDMDGAKRPIPQDGLIIKGTISSSPTWAYILAHPDNIPKMLPEAGGGEVLGPKEESVLSIIDGIKSGSRQDEFRRAGLGLYGPTNPYVQSLVKKGLVKVLGADGLQITLAGKNYRSQRSKWASELEAAWFEGSV